jgi:hypothetical protein
LHNLWYFFLKFFKKNPILKHGGFDESSFLKKIWILTFSSHPSSQILSFRQKNYPTLHSYHSKNNFVTHNTSLHTFFKLNNILKDNSTLNSFFYGENNFFNLVLFFFFLKKNFLKFFNIGFFKTSGNNNTVKLFLLFFFSLNKLKNQLTFFNFNHYNDWFKYNFNDNLFFFFEKSVKKTHRVKLRSSKAISFYKKKLQNFSNFININFNSFLNMWSFYFNKATMSLTYINESFKSLNNTYYPVRFNESSSNKFIELNKISDYCFFYIRKNRIFNKGRYSRNRQTYRTGVYWCLYFNILSVYGLYFIFYRFSFNFGYLWFPLIIFFGSFIFSRAVKYNFFNLNFVVSEIKSFWKWSSLLYNNFYSNFYKLVYSFFYKISSLYLISFLKNVEDNFLLKYLFSYSFTNYFFLIKNSENNFENVWDSLNNSINKFFLKI